MEEKETKIERLEELFKEIDPFYYEKARLYALTHLKQLLGTEEDYWDITLQSIINEIKKRSSTPLTFYKNVL